MLPDRQQEAKSTKTYLTIYCSSEGAPPSVVVERLTRMGFRPIAGPYDFEYEWEENGEVEEMIQIANRVHATLKGCKVFFKLETVSTR